MGADHQVHCLAQIHSCRKSVSEYDRKQETNTRFLPPIKAYDVPRHGPMGATPSGDEL